MKRKIIFVIFIYLKCFAKIMNITYHGYITSIEKNVIIMMDKSGKKTLIPKKNFKEKIYLGKEIQLTGC